MNDPASHQPVPHDPLAVLRGQFPGWEAWRGVSGLLYVRRRMTPSGAGRFEAERLIHLEIIEAIRAHLSRGVEPLIVSYEFRNTGYHQSAMQRPQT